MTSPTIKNFMRQQGFTEEADAVCGMHLAGLNFQPRVLGVLVLLGIILQVPAYFFVLSGILWWNVLVPKWNPFEVFYNGAFGVPRGKPPLGLAPAPRRFAQGMAATFMLLTAWALLQGWMIAAWIVEALLVMALSALVFGKFCLGSYIFHLLRGRVQFANATLPWARRPD
jgi:Domain of unknown function (DUF4395)